MAGVRIAWWSWRETWNARWHGGQDGRRRIPALDEQEHPPYVKRLGHIGGEILHAIAQEWERIDSRLKADYCTAFFHWKTAEAARCELEKEAEQDESLFREAQRLHSDIFGREHFGPVTYALLLFGLGVVEFPLNSVVFELFGGSQVMTYLMTGTLAFGIPVCAHFAGIWFKEEIWRKRPRPSAIYLHLASLLFPALTILGFGYVRERYFEELSAGILNEPMDPRLVFIAFMFLNMVIFVVGIMAAYHHHDPEIKRARHNLKVARRRHTDSEDELARMEALEKTTQETFQEAAARRTNEFERLQHSAREWEQAIYARIETYRIYNRRARPDPGPPASFGTLPAIAFPKGLQELETHCRDIAGARHSTVVVGGDFADAQIVPPTLQPAGTDDVE